MNIFIKMCIRDRIRTVYHDQISIHTLKRLKKQLCRVKVQEGIVFVHGIGPVSYTHLTACLHTMTATPRSAEKSESASVSMRWK